jgi:hypothetical protein
MKRFEIFARGAQLQRLGQISDYTKLAMVLRHNGVSTWVLEAPRSDLVAQVDFGLGFGGLIVKPDDSDEVLLSGSLKKPIRNWSGAGDSMVLAGVDDTVWLDQRLAYPVPAGPPYTASAYDTRTGICETIMRQYVDVNAGPGATEARRVNGLTLAANQARGLSITGRARFQNLLELLQELALAGGGLGFRIVQVGAGLQFQVYTSTDLTASAIFSAELGNLHSYTEEIEAAEANYIIAAGGGEGTARTFREFGDSESILKYGRVEKFRDRRDTTSNAELDQTIVEELAENAEKLGLSYGPTDTARLKFLNDYGLGDKVTVVTSQVTQEVVREVEITITPDSVTAVPVVGTPGVVQEGLEAIFARLKGLSGRLQNLERR